MSHFQHHKTITVQSVNLRDLMTLSVFMLQSDKVEMWWNRKGTGALVMASMEVDKTGSSYYGKQSLHFVSVKGDTVNVPLSEYLNWHVRNYNSGDRVYQNSC